MQSVIGQSLIQTRISVARFLPSGDAVINTALRVRQSDMSKCTVTSVTMKNNMI